MRIQPSQRHGKAKPRRSPRIVLTAVLLIAGLIATALTITPIVPAGAATLNGIATIVNPATEAILSSGGSTTPFTVNLPANAACSGDTASDGYHVYSYLVPMGTAVTSVTFINEPSTGYGLVNNVGSYYGAANTAIGTGQIVSIPTNFEWGPLVSRDGVALSSLLYTSDTSGIWEGGLVCANSSGVVTDNWNTEITFTASGSDPNGFAWSAVPGPSGSEPAAITSASATTFPEGSADTFTVTDTGTPAPTLSESGALPTGVTFTAATGVLAGTPTQTGVFPITFTATNGIDNPATQHFTLSVFDDPGVYVPLTPTRICDTRANNPSHLSGAAAQCSNGTTGRTLAAGGTLTFDVAGDFSVPASNVTAVVLSVATANSKGPGHFTLFPAGATQPTAANLNYATGQVVPNLVEVGVGAGGAVSLYSSAASDAIVDLEGYVTTTPQSGAGLYNALTPARICDTRGSNPSGLSGGATQCNTNTAHGSPDNLIGPNNPLTINVEGNGGVPASGVSAVVLNVAVAKAGAAGFVTVYPAGDARPGASNVNYTAGVAVGNRVIVPVSPSGQVTLYATAATDIIVDVSGWFTASGGTTGAEFTPEVDPVRICDTRGSNPSGLVAPYTQCNTNTAHPSPDNPLVAGTSDLIQATGLANVPTGATAAVLNLADVNPSAGSNLTVYPSGVPPTTSDVNPPTGGVASNLVVATLTGSGSFEVANRGSGHTDIVIDVAGWYTTPA